MTIQILMPALSPTMSEGKITRWLKKEGDAVKAGQTIAEIETDKATMEVEAVDEGRLGKILIPAGTEHVAVNTPIAVLLEEGEGAEALKNVKVAPKSKVPKAEPVLSVVASPPAPKPAFYADEKQYDKFIKLTVREALRDGMAEEMRRNPNVFLMGEEVAQYQGAYKVSQGLLQEF